MQVRNWLEREASTMVARPSHSILLLGGFGRLFFEADMITNLLWDVAYLFLCPLIIFVPIFVLLKITDLIERYVSWRG